MPTNIVDVEVLTDPIVGPAGSDSADKTYVLTIAQGLANRTRWLINRLGGMLGTGEWSYPAVRSRRIHVGANAGFASDGDGFYTIATRVGSTQTEKRYCFDLNQFLRSGEILQQVHAMVKPVAAPGGNPMKLEIFKSTVFPFPTGATIPTVVQLGATRSADGTNNHQLISETNGGPGLAETIDLSTYMYQVSVKTSDAAGAGVGDVIYGLRLILDDPGPRNF